MATAADRASLIGIGFPPITFVVPSGTIDQGARQTFLNLYSGLLAEAPIVPTPPVFVPVYSAPVRFSTISAAGLIQQLAGPEQAYPVYRFTNANKFERPETPGSEYRWARDIEEI